MGCASSKPESPAKPSASRGASSSSKAAVSTRSTAASNTNTTAASTAAAASSSYDSKSAASLSTNGKEVPVAFFGLLGGGANRLSLADRASNTAPDKRLVTAVYAGDDATPPMRRTADAAGEHGGGGSSGNGDAGAGTGTAPGGHAGAHAGVVELRGVAMTLPYVIYVGGMGGVVGAEAGVREVVDAVFAKVNAHLNVWNPDSDIAALNTTPPQKALPIAPELDALFALVDRVYSATEHRFDPTASVLNLASMHAIAEKGRPPMPADVAHLRHAVGWDVKVRRKEKGTAMRTNGNTVVDVDGIAKGFAVDLIFEALSEYVAKKGGAITDLNEASVFVDWAGDVRASGKHPSGRCWRSAVMRPPGLKNLFDRWADGRLHSCLEGADVTHVVDLAHPSVVVASAKAGASSTGDAGTDSAGGGARQFSVESYRANSEVLASMASSMSTRGSAGPRGGVALATSGDYFHIQKFGFHHISSPVDKEVMKAGAHSVASVSVLASTCAMADGLATAAMTFTSKEDAAHFLEGLIRTKPDEVFGYSVVGRTKLHGTNVVSSSYFDIASASVPVSALGGGGSGANGSGGKGGAGTALPQSEVDIIMGGCPRVPCMIRWPGSQSIAQEVDSLTSLSMDPEPVISFTLRTSFVESSPDTIRSSNGSLTFFPGQSDSSGNNDPASLQIQVIKTIRVDEVATIAIAAVVDAAQGMCSTMQLSYANRPISHGLTRALEPAVFVQMPIVEKVKAVLRRVPSGVWIVATEAAHGTRHALTASSVASSAADPTLVTFNVMDRNIFTAAFCGIGATVHVFALEASQEHLASKFVQQSDLRDGDWEGLRAGALLAMELEIEQVSRVKDHLLAGGRVVGANAPQEMIDGRPSPALLWLDRKFEKLTY